MRLQRGFTNKEWKEISEKYKDGGVHMYRGKKTLFYKGEKLCENPREFLVYDFEERNTWRVIIVLPGVEIIPEGTFFQCINVKKVIMADSVRRIEEAAFFQCFNLKFVKLSRNLEFIGKYAFYICVWLTSIFFPPSCTMIGEKAFMYCKQLIIMSVPSHTDLGENVIAHTALIEASYFKVDKDGEYDNNDEVNEWIKLLNQEEEFAIHRECSAYSPPSEERLYEIIKEQGLSSLHTANQIGITALKYLQVNPFFENQIEEKKLINRYVLGLMGEFQEIGEQRVELEHAVRNGIDTEQEESEIKQNNEQIAIESNYQDSKEKETTNEEKVEKSCKRSLQDRIQVLCKLSLMFREQKDVIYADMKRRRLGNSV
ncbi:hypothetical protein CTEN210_13445 [Chaetoceros tenuissimus]|uniref:Leucine-rich repeat domain-containing protein n=1 Tax=Chaetoceros tenuissimus TaxID=426638 RepID=A0AAD3D6N2_9STRA|nr:hypothetical protein CTEN210_13445 [Chaetoceros tenuissimus]